VLGVLGWCIAARWRSLASGEMHPTGARLVVRNWVGGVLVWCIAARMAEHQFSTMYPTDTGHLQSQEDAKKYSLSKTLNCLQNCLSEKVFISKPDISSTRSSSLSLRYL